MNASYRSYVTLALVIALLVLVHLLLQNEPSRRFYPAVTVPWAVNPAPTTPPQTFTDPIQMVNVTVRKKPVKVVAKHLAAAKYVPGHVTTHSELCPRLGAKVLVAVMVASAPENVAARQAIRITWGLLLAKLNLPLAFVLGQHEDEHNATIKEDDKHGDLIIGNFVDSYSNLTLKSLSILEWMSKYCPRAAFLLKIDDDVFLNPRLLQTFATARINETRCIWGKLNRKAIPYRSSKKKYNVPMVEYPGRRFPAFVSGLGYLMSGDCIGGLLAAAGGARFVSMEDVFVTGVAAARGALRRRHSARFLAGGHAPPPPCQLRRLLLLHEARPRDQLDLWWALHDPALTCRSHQHDDLSLDD